MKIPMITTVLSFSILFSACSQEIKGEEDSQEQEKTETSDAGSDEKPNVHKFGGWYCPDNFGFVPVDISNLDEIPAVVGRMPAKWETKTGRALMYVDPLEFPQAKALDMELPALAYVSHPYADFKELAIIIQAFVVDTDTVVGYRFPNGGNGSAWYNQVDLLSEDEIADLAPTPFLFEQFEIKTTKETIWEVFKKSDVAKKISKQFKETRLTKSNWTENLEINLGYENANDLGTGYVANVWGNLYMQIDFVTNGQHTSYKFMVSEDKETGVCTISVAAGPYANNFETKTEDWESLIASLKNTGKE